MTIAGDTYTLGTAAGSTTGSVKVKLDSTNTNNDSEITLKQGANTTIERDSTTGEITIASSDTTVSAVDVSDQSAGFKFEITQSNNVKKSDTIDPKVAVYTDSSSSGTTTNSVSFINGTATLDVYSRGAIDAKLQAVNAMTYRGTIGSDNDDVADSITYNVPVSIGDTFLTKSNGTYNGQTYEKGSLFIVRALDGATENSNGIIAAGDYTCDLVAETFYQDTHYTLVGITNGVKLHSSTGPDCGAFVVTAGSSNTWIDVAESSSGSGNNVTKTLTITHKAVTRTNTTGTAQSQPSKGSITIPVITGVTSDSAGHITGVETTNYTLTDTNATLKSVTSTTTSYNDTTNGYKAGVVETTVQLKNSNNSDGTAQSSKFVLSSSSLDITDKDDRPDALSGGSNQQGLKIDMVWGSF